MCLTLSLNLWRMNQTWVDNQLYTLPHQSSLVWRTVTKVRLSCLRKIRSISTRIKIIIAAPYYYPIWVENRKRNQFILYTSGFQQLWLVNPLKWSNDYLCPFITSGYELWALKYFKRKARKKNCLLPSPPLIIRDTFLLSSQGYISLGHAAQIWNHGRVFLCELQSATLTLKILFNYQNSQA